MHGVGTYGYYPKGEEVTVVGGAGGTARRLRESMKTSANSKCANQVSEECPFLESQRDSATKPRVARNELPWVRGAQNNNPNGVATRGARSPKPKPRWGFVFLIRCPRVARSSNPGLRDAIPLGLANFQNLLCARTAISRKISLVSRTPAGLNIRMSALQPRSV